MDANGCQAPGYHNGVETGRGTGHNGSAGREPLRMTFFLVVHRGGLHGSPALKGLAMPFWSVESFSHPRTPCVYGRMTRKTWSNL